MRFKMSICKTTQVFARVMLEELLCNIIQSQYLFSRFVWSYVKLALMKFLCSCKPEFICLVDP